MTVEAGRQDVAESSTVLAGNGVADAATPSCAELVERAAALRPLLIEQQPDTERRGHYSPALHEEFQQAGFSRILQPRMFGGYELDLGTFFAVVSEIARGNPSAAWCLSLGSGHALPMAAYFNERAQRETFGPDGDFRAPHRNQGGFGSATPVDGGVVVNATYNYCSGVPYSTHFMGTTLLSDPRGSERPKQLVVVIPRGEYEIQDDWGNGSILGMQGSGSNSVKVENVFVPDHMTAPYNWTTHTGPTHGTALHKNPLYVGRMTAFYAGEVISVAVGTARAALDEFERIVTTKKTIKAPQVLRYETAEVQRVFGLALTMVDAAESLLNDVGNLYTEYARAWYDDEVPFTWKMDTRLRGRVHQAGRLAADAVDLLFQNAGSSAAMYGQRMQRYYRDISVFKGHPTGTVDAAAVVHAQTYFGLDAPASEVLG